MTLELAALVADASPFVTGERSDGTVLPDYFDGHRVLGNPALLTRVADALARRVQQVGADFVAGEATAGSSLAVAVSLASLRHGGGTPSRIVRRESKPYGVTGILGTGVPPGSSFALVDDVAGTGASLERSTRRLRRMGHRVVGAWVIVDRHAGAAERLARLGVPLSALLTLDQIKSARTASTA
ncbi:orotate phosphoribosyltransferase [Streptomyces phyllanthi]|uniref:Orotate phosphoribosyltransferase n=1 Tax=Streptomyces phyllanthi TaxID=1803180 RepID=A0A5N8VVF3_9ACTN|nr:phosphoribosyltransferase family protein [Streptomyces phyllanthi]MPY38969.1 orotate phosphoribosyltransferase [Streptomyces phyllanthi]